MIPPIQDIMKNQNTWLFLGGVAVGAVAVTILGSKAARDLAVAGIAQGMKIRDEAMATLCGIQEDAQDVYAEKISEKTEAADEFPQEIDVTRTEV